MSEKDDLYRELQPSLDNEDLLEAETRRLKARISELEAENKRLNEEQEEVRGKQS